MSFIERYLTKAIGSLNKGLLTKPEYRRNLKSAYTEDKLDQLKTIGNTSKGLLIIPNYMRDLESACTEDKLDQYIKKFFDAEVNFRNSYTMRKWNWLTTEVAAQILLSSGSFDKDVKEWASLTSSDPHVYENQMINPIYLDMAAKKIIENEREILLKSMQPVVVVCGHLAMLINKGQNICGFANIDKFKFLLPETRDKIYYVRGLEDNIGYEEGYFEREIFVTRDFEETFLISHSPLLNKSTFCRKTEDDYLPHAENLFSVEDYINSFREIEKSVLLEKEPIIKKLDEVIFKNLDDLKKEINRGLGWGIVAHNVGTLAETLVNKYGIEDVSDIINNHIFFDIEHEYSDITNKWASLHPFSLERNFDLVLNSRPAFIDEFVENLIDIEREKGLNRENMDFLKTKLKGIQLPTYRYKWDIVEEKETEQYGTIYLLKYRGKILGEEYFVIADNNKNILVEDAWRGLFDSEEKLAKSIGCMRNKVNGIELDGYGGSWYVVEERKTDQHGTIYLLEHEEYGDETPCIIVDSNKNILVEDVWNGFLDYEETFIEKSYSHER